MDARFLPTCLVIVSFAVAVVAPAALASPVLTDSGVKVATGTTVVGINTGNVRFAGGFEVECASATLTGKVTSNTGTKIKGEVPVGSASFIGTEAGGDCSSWFGATAVTVNSKLCFETVTSFDNVNITGCGGNVTFTLNVTSQLSSCKYSTASVSGTFRTSTAATIEVRGPEAAKEEGPFWCPGLGELIMDFDLKKTSGAPFTVS